ncbi:MAG: ATP-binding protein [Deltaproteobacteria bacterium]|nr:ATP-binding protein [Deltaproteobacteria bacterium]
MDARKNPFAPGAGTQPPELAGRSGTVTDAEVAIARAKGGLSSKSQLLLGLRGVGKTVLLNRVAEIAQAERCLTVSLEAPEANRLAEMLVPPLRSALFKLSGTEKAKLAAQKTLGVLRSFAAAFKVKVGDVEFGVRPETGTADSGQLEFDLAELLQAVGAAAREDASAFVLLIDEVQYLGSQDLAALIVAVHRVGQKGLPFVLFGAGLPQLAALAGDAKSYAERLFDYPDVGPLTREAAVDAIRAPVRRQGVEIDDQALDLVIETTKGYPYFLQEWGYQTWNVATASPIGAADARLATRGAIERLDRGFFRVRFDRLTPKEKHYMRAMASLGPGPHRSGDIAHALKRPVSSVAPLRGGLLTKGMIYSPQHGDTAFTVPMFDEFMKRTMPGWEP